MGVREQDIRMKDLLRVGNDVIVPADTVSHDDDFVKEEPTIVEGADSVIQVQLVDVEPIKIAEIVDVHGRISDIVESLELKLNIAVVPLSMARIAPEISRLQRHELYELGGQKYAMAKRPRESVVSKYCERIVKTLSSGLPFSESLMINVDYNGTMYRTIALSQVEWTLILSRFRNYKEVLKIVNKNELVMEILAEPR